jgi:hypothetical protein
MKSFTVALLFCMLVVALGAFASQGSMQQPAQTPQAPGAASQTSQQPGTMPPSAAPQSQPGTVQSPEAQTPKAEPSQAPPMHAGTPGIDQQVSALSAALNLTSDQQAKVKTILEDQHQQAVIVVNDSSLAQDAKVQKMHDLRKSTVDKVRGTLTSDEQKNKFDAMVQAQNDRIHATEQQQQQQNNTPAPK